MRKNSIPTSYRNKIFFWNTNYNHHEALCELEKKLSPEIKSLVENKTVIDFGCGSGEAAICLSKSGAKRVYGIDLRDHSLKCANELAQAVGSDCIFTYKIREKADVIISIDTFHLYDDPQTALIQMKDLLKENGKIFMCLGPSWLHPAGSSIVSLFPWSHLFSGEGKKMLSISKLERLIKKSQLKVKNMELVSDGFWKYLTYIPFFREFATQFIRCELVLN